MMKPTSQALVAALLLAAGTASAQTGMRPGTQPPPSSPYADGTGNSQVDRLNSGQLDQNYKGPWHVVPPRDAMGGSMPGTMQGGMPGSMPGSMPGTMPGTMQGGMQGPMSGNGPGMMPPPPPPPGGN